MALRSWRGWRWPPLKVAQLPFVQTHLKMLPPSARVSRYRSLGYGNAISLDSMCASRHESPTRWHSLTRGQTLSRWMQLLVLTLKVGETRSLQRLLNKQGRRSWPTSLTSAKRSRQLRRALRSQQPRYLDTLVQRYPKNLIWHSLLQLQRLSDQNELLRRGATAPLRTLRRHFAQGHLRSVLEAQLLDPPRSRSGC